MLTAANPACDFSGSVQSWFGETVTTDGGGVGTMVIGGQVFEGTELRTLLHPQLRQVHRGGGRRGNPIHRLGLRPPGGHEPVRAPRPWRAPAAPSRRSSLHYYTGVTLTRMTATD